MSSGEQFYLISALAAGGSGGEFAYTYESEIDLQVGQFVEVPFGRQRSLGIVMGLADKPKFATKPIASILELPPLPKHLVELAKWLSEYYAAGPKSVWQTLLPSGLEVNRRAAKPEDFPTLPHTASSTLNNAQNQVVETIMKSDRQTYLLHGVTGSGKTEVYLDLAKRTLAAGRSVIVLVPEIALTPQLESRFGSVFGSLIVASHSRMTPAKRHAVWLQALSATKPLVAIGPRSALFLPVKDPGLIIIDECHESTYKQEQAPRYQTDITAGRLAQLTHSKLILGSATPSLTQHYLAGEDKIGLVELKVRANNIPPAIPQVVDLRIKTPGSASQFLSPQLIKAVTETLASGRQSLLFMNRRGSASSLICTDCSWVATCPTCGISLTFHADVHKLVCHYCNYQMTPPAVCPSCHQTNLRYLGGGTQRIETEVTKLFPAARIARLDKDTSNPAMLHKLFADLHAGKIDILVGTQMIAKGWDLPAVDLVGIVSADTLLHIPDFTASERTYQLISQVAGRTGRGDRAGQVIIQSYTPEHPAIVAAAGGDYHAFAEAELTSRRLLAYPPFVYLLKLTCNAKQEATARNNATKLAAELIKNPNVKVAGPAPTFRLREGSNYRWQLIVRAKQRKHLVEIANHLPSGTTADLDPVSLL